MRVEVLLTRDDLRKGMPVHNPGWALKRVLSVAGSLSLIALGLVLPHVQRTRAGVSDVSELSLASLSLGFGLTAVFLGQLIAINRALDRRASALQPSTLDFGPLGLHVEAPGSTADIRWTALRQFKESKEHLLLYVGPDQYILVPIRAFSSEDEANQCRELVKDGLSNDAGVGHPTKR
jgi:hypothetical protein